MAAKLARGPKRGRARVSQTVHTASLAERAACPVQIPPRARDPVPTGSRPLAGDHPLRTRPSRVLRAPTSRRACAARSPCALPCGARAGPAGPRQAITSTVNATTRPRQKKVMMRSSVSPTRPSPLSPANAGAASSSQVASTSSGARTTHASGTIPGAAVPRPTHRVHRRRAAARTPSTDPRAAEVAVRRASTPSVSGPATAPANRPPSITPTAHAGAWGLCCTTARFSAPGQAQPKLPASSAASHDQPAGSPTISSR